MRGGALFDYARQGLGFTQIPAVDVAQLLNAGHHIEQMTRYDT